MNVSACKGKRVQAKSAEAARGGGQLLNGAQLNIVVYMIPSTKVAQAGPVQGQAEELQRGRERRTGAVFRLITEKHQQNDQIV